MRIGPVCCLRREMDRGSVESLETLAEHWTVPLREQATRNVNDAVGVDPEEVAVVGEMVDRAEGEAVDDRGDAFGLGVFDDVGCLDEGRLAQRTDRAPLAVGTEDVA